MGSDVNPQAHAQRESSSLKDINLDECVGTDQRSLFKQPTPIVTHVPTWYSSETDELIDPGTLRTARVKRVLIDFNVQLPDIPLCPACSSTLKQDSRRPSM